MLTAWSLFDPHDCLQLYWLIMKRCKNSSCFNTMIKYVKNNTTQQQKLTKICADSIALSFEVSSEQSWLFFNVTIKQLTEKLLRVKVEPDEEFITTRVTGHTVFEFNQSTFIFTIPQQQILFMDLKYHCLINRTLGGKNNQWIHSKQKCNSESQQ